MLFIQYSALSNYADDKNLFVMEKSKEDIKDLLLLDFEIVNNWFYENFMVLKPGKSHYMCLGKSVDDKKEKCWSATKSSREVEILGIKIDNNLNFNKRIKSICRKADQKLSALLRISSNTNIRQKKLLHKSMVKSRFNYCPLVWIL